MDIDGVVTRMEGDRDESPLPPALGSSRSLGLVLDDATLAKVRKVVTDGTPANTRRAYAADLRFFAGWRAASGFGETWPVPAEVLVRFVVEQIEGMSPAVEDLLVAEGFKKAPGIQSWSTVERRVAAIATAHRTRGLSSPLADPIVTEILGLSRRASVARGWAPKRKAAADRQILERLLNTCEDSLIGIRDRAILLFGFSTGGRRRSEIAEATFERLQRVGQQYVYRMGRTKSEQDGSERPVPLSGRAAKAVARWIASAGIQDGALFRAVWDNGTVMPEAINARTIARMIKRRAALAELDAEEFGGHSLRAGFMTEAGARRISMIEAMSLSGHKDVNTAAIYYRAGEILSVDAGRMMEGEAASRASEPVEEDLASAGGAAVEVAGAAEDRSINLLSSRDFGDGFPEIASYGPPPSEADDTMGPPCEPDLLSSPASAEITTAAGVLFGGLDYKEPIPQTVDAVPHPDLSAFRPSFLSD